MLFFFFCVIGLSLIFYFFYFDLWETDTSAAATICCISSTTLKNSPNNSKNSPNNKKIRPNNNKLTKYSTKSSFKTKKKKNVIIQILNLFNKKLISPFLPYLFVGRRKLKNFIYLHVFFFLMSIYSSYFFN